MEKYQDVPMTQLSTEIGVHTNDLIQKAIEQHSRENHEAKQALFGYAKEEENEGQLGKVIVEDIYLDNDHISLKVLDHVAIDQFTGAANDGALFNEQVAYYKGEKPIPFTLLIHQTVAEKYRTALMAAINDLKSGHLPLGGLTQHGHGSFSES